MIIYVVRYFFFPFFENNFHKIFSPNRKIGYYAMISCNFVAGPNTFIYYMYLHHCLIDNKSCQLASNMNILQISSTNWCTTNPNEKHMKLSPIYLREFTYEKDLKFKLWTPNHFTNFRNHTSNINHMILSKIKFIFHMKISWQYVCGCVSSVVCLPKRFLRKTKNKKIAFT